MYCALSSSKAKRRAAAAAVESKMKSRKAILLKHTIQTPIIKQTKLSRGVNKRQPADEFKLVKGET